MAEAASAHRAATATHEETSPQRAGRRRRTSAEPQRAQPGPTAAAAAAPAAQDNLSRLQQLAEASPQVAQLRRLQALADAYYAPVAQLAGGPEEEELVQGKFATAELQPQLQQAPRVNNTGLPDQLKSGIELLSGLSMDDVRVHYNSSQPAQLSALAYAQGGDIHLGPGQERHLPHEAWHVVQQAQGRVQPTMQAKGQPINDDRGLEHEADVMGAKALQIQTDPGSHQTQKKGQAAQTSPLIQGMFEDATDHALAKLLKENKDNSSLPKNPDVQDRLAPEEAQKSPAPAPYMSTGNGGSAAAPATTTTPPNYKELVDLHKSWDAASKRQRRSGAAAAAASSSGTVTLTPEERVAATKDGIANSARLSGHGRATHGRYASSSSAASLERDRKQSQKEAIKKAMDNALLAKKRKNSKQDKKDSKK